MVQKKKLALIKRSFFQEDKKIWDKKMDISYLETDRRLGGKSQPQEPSSCSVTGRKTPSRGKGRTRASLENWMRGLGR